MKLLFICTGNICRSPTAEGIVKSICKKQNLKSIICDSAGLYDYHIGEKPDSRSINIAKNNKIDINNLKARKISSVDFNKFDLIIGMDSNHVLQLKEYNNKIEKICLFLDFTVEFKNQDVPDPYYGKLEDFEKTFELIKIGAEAIVEKFK